MNYLSVNTYEPTSNEGEQPIRTSPVRDTGGATIATVRDGVVVTQSTGVERASSSGESEYTDWRATARGTDGLPARTYTPQTIVEIGEYGESSIASFINMGVMREVSPGQYEVVQEREQTQEHDACAGENAALMPEKVAQWINNAVEPFHDSTLAAGTALGMSVATGEMDETELVKRVAQESGMEPGEAADRIRFVTQAYQMQTDKYLEKQGVSSTDLEDFYEFARTQKGQMMDALQSQIYGQDMKPWKGLVSKYLSTTPPSKESLEAAGLHVRGELVWIDGGWMSIKAAARAGLI